MRILVLVFAPASVVECSGKSDIREKGFSSIQRPWLLSYHGIEVKISGTEVPDHIISIVK